MELLSPAGSFEALEAAVNYGADAVYVGGARFSARKNATNFTDEDLERAVDYCHLRGVKLYLCCNTLMKESELSSVMEFVCYAYQIGVDALIVQDLGLLSRIRRELPDFPVHASTQMTVVNSAGVQQLWEMGVKRVVLARELSGQNIGEICKNTEVEIEVFVHGALCISYSGQCLMSSLIGGRSGNRGDCAQPCRLPYTLLENGREVTEHVPLLCPKDLCLADRVQELGRMGVASLKIEGRMKSPEYVAMVTQVYKQAISGSVTEDDIRSMLRFFSRGGSCHGYFDGCTYGGMMDPASASKISASLPVIEKKQKKMPVSLFLAAETHKPLTLVLTDDAGHSVSMSGPDCQQAHTHPSDPMRLKEQVEKLGDTPFEAEHTEVIASKDVAVSVKEVNALRREAAEQLSQKICEEFKRKPVYREMPLHAENRVKTVGEVTVEITTEEQLKAAVELGIRRIYIPAELWHLKGLVKEPVLLLDPITKEGQSARVEDADQVCIQNLGQLSLCGNRRVSAGHRLNVTNAETVAALHCKGINLVALSPELHLTSIEHICRNTPHPIELIVYGHLPLMLLENCIIKSSHHCGCKHSSFALKDRKNEIFPLMPRRCGNVILNSKPIYMADRMEKLEHLSANGYKLLFTIEDGVRCRQIIQAYQQALSGLGKPSFNDSYTRGHFYRGMQ